ncbi:iron/ascorbate family oxidoreductase [Colletotrichum navitas]|uniref:Iron/ascorbate family oxidoreductase n=1 Tax=Colletotrichum navitas TaxID=681940 RepID=A0AAD8PV85_9PEZI|nr:iron/ascorbate family oxidoreductase [Colletotrichum navitas]KAK1580592.1 iron/ascorbate family oxidoreductase [Colletotrichum navitas]
MKPSSHPMHVPTLDCSHFQFHNDGHEAEFAAQLIDSFKRTGFVKLRNHGIPDNMIQDLFRWMREFFSLTPEDKQEAHHPPSRNTPQRGWSKYGDESTGYLQGAKGVERADVKEHFDVGDVTDILFPTRWPNSSLPGFQPFVESYYTVIYTFAPDASDLRLAHYPPVPASLITQGKAARIWPHTDFGLITPLFQDGVGGLEIENRAKCQNHPNLQADGKNDDEPDFLPVEPEPGNIMILNVSDTLERWTNGELPAGVHCVVLPSTFDQDVNSSGEAGLLPDRYSTAFFFKAARGQDVSPMDVFVTEEKKAKFPPMTSAEYQRFRTQTMYSYD